MSQHVVRRFRPYLFTNFSCTCRAISSSASKASKIELSATFTAPYADLNVASSESRLSTTSTQPDHDVVSHDYLKRVEHLEASKTRAEWYPRLGDATKESRLSISEYTKRYDALSPDETIDDHFTVIGRIQSIRTAGSKLIFVTIAEDEHTLQIVLKHAQLSDKLKAFFSIARKGDTYAFSGQPHRTARGQMSVLATDQPSLLSPSLHQIPEKLSDFEILSHHRHVHMLVDPDARQTLRLRHTVERTINDFLCSNDFIKVSTPILQSSAGGAIARPFETEATEMHGKKLQLRIAPELWLKRLIVGGMSRIYEMGPVFRNEGVDATHNPEFTMCEFYAAHATLDELMHWTEQLLVRMVEETARYGVHSEPPTVPFAQLEFIPTLESKLGCALPDLESADGFEQLEAVFKANAIPIPHNHSLPRLLDALAGHYIEPLCNKPTFITHHPAVLSPLSKRFRCPRTGQLISARAELFIDQFEIANMYEEQNSPFEQKAAFLEQLKHRAIDGESDGKAEIDHAYIEALEWGLPPTGGWGCGVDRLVMLLAGKSKLGDVLSFGGLRNVVGIGRGR